MPLTKTPAEVIIDGVDVSKADLRLLLEEMEATVSGGGGGENLGAGYEVAYLNFADKADGALLTSLAFDTGQPFAFFSGTSYTTAHVVNTDGESGYLVSPDGTFYAILDFPHKNFVASMLVSWDAPDAGPGMAMGCGHYVDGSIFVNMVHAQSNFQNPFMTLWGTGHDDPGQPNMLEANIVPQNSFRDKATLKPISTPTRITVIVIGNCCSFFYDDQHWVKQFNYQGDAGGGAGSISELVGDYIYFETTGLGAVRVHDMYAKEITPSDWSTYFPTPVASPISASDTQLLSKTIAKNTKEEIFRFTMSEGQSTRVTVDMLIEAAGDVDSYAACGGTYVFTATRYGNPASSPYVAGPGQLGADQKPSQDAGTLALTPTFYVDVDGNDVVVSAKGQASGSDASSYTPLCQMRVNFTGAAYELTESA